MKDKEDKNINNENEQEKCPVCGGVVYQTGKCKTCQECGWSSCSYG